MRGVKTKADHKWKRIGVFLILLVIFGLLLGSASRVYKKKKGAEEILARMEADKKTLEEREKFLKNSLHNLTTEEGIKFEIRKKLNVAEVGESVAIIVDEEESSSAKSQNLSSWQKLKNFLTNLFE